MYCLLPSLLAIVNIFYYNFNISTYTGLTNNLAAECQRTHEQLNKIPRFTVGNKLLTYRSKQNIYHDKRFASVDAGPILINTSR